MKNQKIHSWNVTTKQALEIQKELAGRVSFKPLKTPIKMVAGVDCAFTKDDRIVSCAVLFSYPLMKLIESVHTVKKVQMPYIPGLLSFREAPACIDALLKLKQEPDLILIDGQGVAHPRRLGLASHIGLFVDKPTIGCAKSRLIGDYVMPDKMRGRYSILTDHDEKIGYVLRTRTNVKPLFVSVGHKCSFDDILPIVLQCALKYRLPEPTRIADRMVSRIKISLLS